MMSYQYTDLPITVNSENVKYSPSEITSEYVYDKTVVVNENNTLVVKPVAEKYTFKTQRTVPKTGLLLIGWGGNNGTTVTAGILANKHKVTWETKRGTKDANYYGSLIQSSTVRLGAGEHGDIFVPLKNLVPFVNPNDLVIGGWDINNMNMADALKRAAVYDYTFQQQVAPYMKDMVPMPSIYYPDYIAANQCDRANNLIPGDDKQVHLDTIRKNIRDFKKNNNLDKVIVLWTANTERYSDVIEGINDTAENILKAIKNSEKEVAPSNVFATACILEHTTFINGSPQNTLLPGIIELAEREGTFIAGNDFKSGQTKMKSVLAEYLIDAGIKPVSIASYNHLGNNDGKNLSSPMQFRSKEISKSGVVEDMVESNGILYKNGEKPDHLIVIKYIPYVGDSKRAIDEYTSEIFCHGINTISMHNVCEDSLLAAPLMIDLVVLAEMCERISFSYEGSKGYEHFDSVLSILSYLTKAPAVPVGTPIVNGLSKQRACIVNFLRACIGLKPENNMLFEYKLRH
ncbi:hypothetical protein WA158_003104 [Blastocystis sp. Blastoise]